MIAVRVEVGPLWLVVELKEKNFAEDQIITNSGLDLCLMSPLRSMPHAVKEELLCASSSVAQHHINLSQTKQSPEGDMFRIMNPSSMMETK